VDVLTHHEDQAISQRVRGGVRELCQQFPAPGEAA